MPMILVSLDDGSPIIINKAVVFFGRSHECDIVLAQSRKVSRKHCCLAQINESYLVRDLGSMNGVRVNEQKADPELPLEVGDELWVGDVGFRFQPHTSDHGMPVQRTEKVIPETSEQMAPKKVAPDKFLNAPPPSLEHPVAIPEESKEFIIEESIQQQIIDSDEN